MKGKTEDSAVKITGKKKKTLGVNKQKGDRECEQRRRAQSGFMKNGGLPVKLIVRKTPVCGKETCAGEGRKRRIRVGPEEPETQAEPLGLAKGKTRGMEKERLTTTTGI